MTKEPAPQLERALSLRDLVLFNLVAVIGIGWVATAAKAGPSALTLWLLAAILFFVPQGLAVIQLSSSFPAEGGIYAWTKKEFGEGHGFVCGWCYWINNVLFYPTLLLAGAVSATYIIGQGESGLANNWTYVLPFTLIALTLAVMLNVVGVDTGKWLQNIGGVSVDRAHLRLRHRLNALARSETGNQHRRRSASGHRERHAQSWSRVVVGRAARRTLSYSGENRRTRRLADRVSARRLRGRTRSLFPGCFRARSSALAHALRRDSYSGAARRLLSFALRPGQGNYR